MMLEYNQIALSIKSGAALLRNLFFDNQAELNLFCSPNRLMYLNSFRLPKTAGKYRIGQ
jgi:hypothetical protein